ncbi:hypothetical protein ZWY2020_045130 [Hordeum vulgare]|nr:hypothetical protein ZWY2020_045130 [Hordeum vulgare]
MGNACRGSLRSKYLHSFKHPASQHHDPDRDYDHNTNTNPVAAVDSRKKQPGTKPAAKMDGHAAPAQPATAMRQGQFGTTYLCTELATGADYACKSISKRAPGLQIERRWIESRTTTAGLREGEEQQGSNGGRCEANHVGIQCIL